MYCPPFKSCKLYKEMYLKCPKNTQHPKEKHNLGWTIKKGSTLWDELKIVLRNSFTYIFYAPKFYLPNYLFSYLSTYLPTTYLPKWKFKLFKKIFTLSHMAWYDQCTWTSLRISNLDEWNEKGYLIILIWISLLPKWGVIY